MTSLRGGERTETGRGYISLREKLASALCQMLCDDGTGKLVPVIPYEHAKQMTADQVLSLFEWDHWPRRKADGGEDVHHNLVPRFAAEHQEKTSTIDIPQMAKAARIRKREAGIKPDRKITSWRKFDKTAVYAPRAR